MTIPRSVGQLPIYYDQKPSAHRGYLFESRDPLFPFGFGLSYTTFEVGTPRLSVARVHPGEPVTVSVDVRNTGAVPGDEVVQLYVHQVVGSVTRPVKQLAGFRRIRLAPGAPATVQFILDPGALSLWDEHMRPVEEPGSFEIMAGPDSASLKSTALDVTL